MNDRNDFIQYLRGYAALMVVLDHSLLRLAHTDPTYSGIIAYAGDLGALGVQIFFVISGYIMVTIAYESFSQPGAVMRFWVSRIRRIVPLYWIATLTVLLMPSWLSDRDFSIEDVIRSLIFAAPNARPEEGALLPVLGVGWTLNYEMFFYLIFGASLWVQRGIGLAFSIFLLFFLITVGQLMRIVGHDFSPLSIAHFYTHQIMGLFAIGMLIALWRRGPWFRQFPMAFPAELGAAIAVSTIIVLNLSIPGQYPLWRTLLMYTLASLPVLLCVATLPRPRNSFLELLGNASFSIYLFHGFGLSVFGILWIRLFGLEMASLRILFCFSFGTAVGIAAYFLLERPMVAAFKAPTRKS